MARSRNYLICAFLIAATLAVYWQTTGFNFTHYDDQVYVTENAEVKAGLTAHGIAWAFTGVAAGNWHPFTWLSHMLDCQMNDLDPSGHHLTSVLLHALNVILLFAILNRLTKAAWRSGFVAALFAMHPLHVESVAWIAERKDVLSTFFWLATIWAYARYVERPALRRYLAVALLLALGLMSKPMLVTVPLVLLLLDYWPLGRLGPGRARFGDLVREKAPLLALAAVSAVVTLVVQSETGAVGTLDRYPPGLRAENAVVSCAGYVLKMVWPTRLACCYPYPVAGLALGRVASAGIALVCVTYLAIRWARKAPWLAVGWLWYLVTLAPVIGLVQVGTQSMADRYTYVPLIGLFIIVAWGVPYLAGGGAGRLSAGWRAALGVVSLAVIVGLASAAHRQAGYWRNDFTLFGRAVAVTRDNALAQYNLGRALLGVGDLEEAIPHLREAARIVPDLEVAHTSLASALLQLGRTDEAVKELRESVRIKPDDPVTRGNLAAALMHAKKGDKAAR